MLQFPSLPQPSLAAACPTCLRYGKMTENVTRRSPRAPTACSVCQLCRWMLLGTQRGNSLSVAGCAPLRASAIIRCASCSAARSFLMPSPLPGTIAILVRLIWSVGSKVRGTAKIDTVGWFCVVGWQGQDVRWPFALAGSASSARGRRFFREGARTAGVFVSHYTQCTVITAPHLRAPCLQASCDSFVVHFRCFTFLRSPSPCCRRLPVQCARFRPNPVLDGPPRCLLGCRCMLPFGQQVC